MKFLFALCFFCTSQLMAQRAQAPIPGAYQIDQYLHILKGQRVAIFANPTSEVNGVSLVDTLVKRGVNIVKIFAPEHGFRGNADAGEKVDNFNDPATGIPVVSLYGNKHYKPKQQELEGVDELVFDIQDVGVRFYTYISSLQYFMEAAIENNLPLLILDRPNPNGFYVDGPVLQPAYKSFVGMQPIPVVYGMTMGEYAKMLYGEKWVNPAQLAGLPPRRQPEMDTPFDNKGKEKSSTPVSNFVLKIIPCKNYNHKMTYNLPVKPSPNLPDLQSILLYPSTCYFEGTDLSLGRGTATPFQVYGHPNLPDTLFAFTPQSVEGAKNPPQLNKKCYGEDLSKVKIEVTQANWKKIQLKWLLKAYQAFPDKSKFFLTPKTERPAGKDFFFNKLMGNDWVMQMIKAGKTETQIRAAWKNEVARFKKIRRKYLLYADFE
jgi:uncharacterized protein YbbC (DUF1343 family)